jgi:hypothetical protein
MNRKKDIFFAVAGLSVLAFAVQRIGLEAVVREIKIVRIGLPIILALSLLRLVLQTKSWSIALRQDGVQASIAELMFIRLASQGIGYLTILGPVASEPMKTPPGEPATTFIPGRISRRNRVALPDARRAAIPG